MGSKVKQAIFLAKQREAHAEPQQHATSPDVSLVRRHEKRVHKQRAWSERGHDVTPEEAFTQWVTSRLTTRNQQWVHEGSFYHISWKDISLHTFGELEAEVRSQLASVGIHGVEFSRKIDGFALRITIPENQFNAEVLAKLGSGQPLRIHEQVARGGR